MPRVDSPAWVLFAPAPVPDLGSIAAAASMRLVHGACRYSALCFAHGDAPPPLELARSRSATHRGPHYVLRARDVLTAFEDGAEQTSQGAFAEQHVEALGFVVERRFFDQAAGMLGGWAQTIEPARPPFCACGWEPGVPGRCRRRPYSESSTLCAYCDDSLLHRHCEGCGWPLRWTFEPVALRCRVCRILDADR